MSAKRRNFSQENTNNKIFLPSIFNNDSDFNIHMDPKLYLQQISNKTTKTQRTRSLYFWNQFKQTQKNEPIQMKNKPETEKDIFYSFEDQYQQKDNKQQQTNKVQIKLYKNNQNKEIKIQELVNCYCQKLSKKKPSSHLRQHKLDLEFL